MKSSIMCLPITIPAEIKPGLVLTPFTVWIMSKLLGVSAVCSINLTGMKYAGMRAAEIKDRYRMFERIMGRLGIKFDTYWLDNDRSHTISLQEYCDQLSDNHYLRQENLEVLACNCGAVEVLRDAVTSKWATERKLIREVGGQLQCKLCGSPLTLEHNHVLVLDSGFRGNPITAFPSFYQKEIDMLQDDYNQPVLISRKRKSGRKVRLFAREWTLDTDFCWSFLFHSLGKEEFEPEFVVVSNRSIKPLVLSYGISRKISGDVSPISAIVTPFVQIKSSPVLDINKASVSLLIDRYGRTPVRFLLGSFLKWKQKDLIVDSSLIFWTMKAIEKAADYAESTATSVSLPEVLSMTDGNTITSLIADMRRSEKIALTPYQKLLIGKEN